MSAVEKLKQKYLNKLVQYSLLDEKGYVVESCDALFSTTKLQKKSVTDWLPFLESIFPLLINLKELDAEIYFSRVESPHPKLLKGYYDFSFKKINVEDKMRIQWVIFDHTCLYSDFKKMQQQHNEAEIKRQQEEYSKRKKVKES